MPLKYLCNFWKTLEMLLINFEINLILTWSANCSVFEGDRKTTFTIPDKKFYVLAVNLSTQNNTKLL